MAYDDIEQPNAANEVPADQFSEQINPIEDDDEQLIMDETNDDVPANAFRERLDEAPASAYDDDFTRSLDPEENPDITDQFEDENLQREAEDDYR